MKQEMEIKSIIFITVILECKLFHVLEGDFAFIVPIEDSGKGGDISGCGMKLLIHGSIQVHEHFTRCDSL